MIRIFITRKLDPNSPLLKTFDQSTTHWTHRSLIHFEPLDFEVPPNADWMFFYSKTGVDFFFKHKNVDISALKIACFGPSTASKYKEVTGSPPDFTGIGEKNATAEAFLKKAKGSDVCFIQASNSRESIQSAAQGEIICHDVAVYNNLPVSGLHLGDFDIAIITSPMNAQAFVENAGTASQYIAIGATTEMKLNSYLLSPVYVADKPTETGILQKLIEITDAIDP